MLLRHLSALPTIHNHNQTVNRKSLLSIGDLPGIVQTMNYAWLDIGMSLENHSHPDGCEAYFFLEGEGKLTVVDHEYKVQAHDFVIIHPNESHTLCATSKHITFLTLRTIDS